MKKSSLVTPPRSGRELARSMMGKEKDPGLNKNTAPNGVYILRTNDKLYTNETWNTEWNEEAVGVAVLTSECRFVISPTAATTRVWSKDEIIVPGVALSEYAENAKTEFKGFQNTNSWIAHYGPTVDYSAGWCADYTFINGKKGYLASAGEWLEAFNYKKTINQYMKLINGKNIIAGTYVHWTSTQASAGSAWYFAWADGIIGSASSKRLSVFRVRAFTTL